MKLSRGLVVGLGITGLVVIVLLVVATIWVNSFLHSDAFRHEVEAHASQTFGGKVEIKQIDWSILSGVKVEGLVTHLSSDHGTLEMQVESVSCTYSLGELIHRKLHLESVTVKKPQIVVTPESNPALSPAGQKETGAVTGEAQPVVGEKASFDLTVEAVKIDDGELSIQDETGVTKAHLEGIASKVDTSGFFVGKDVTGTLTVATISLPQNLQLTDFSTPFTYNNGSLSATPFQMSGFSGKINGSYKLDPSGPSVLEVTATGLDMAQIGAAANPSSPTKLTGLLNLQSTWNKVETGMPVGQGNAQIANGKLVGDPLLRDLSEAFKIAEMSDPDLASVAVHFDVTNGTTHFDHLQIVSTVFEMSGSGVIDAKGNLNADMTLTLHPGAFARIPKIAVNFFTKLPDGGGSIPFKLTGTAEHPQSDVMTKAFIQGSKIDKSIKKTLNNLFK